MSMFKPMLAATVEDVSRLIFPLYASPKLDGIRAIVHEDKLVSRNLKVIPNKSIQEMFDWSKFPSLDGELIVGDPCAKDCFRTTTSGVMSEDGEPKVAFHVFDIVSRTSTEFTERYNRLKKIVTAEKSRKLQLVPNVILKDAFELFEYEQRMLEKGFEGVILRDPAGLYKFGRSTLREGYLMKLKRFCDSEAVIVGFDERMHNANTKTTDELGRAKRSSHKAGKQPTNTLGSLRVRDLTSGVEFDVGTGMDDSLRADIWVNRKKNLGRVVKYKFFPSGSKDKPRFPVFLGFREKGDMS